MLKQTTFVVVIGLGLTVALTTTAITYLHTGNDWNDSCRDAGYNDGRNGPFSQGSYDHCGEEEGSVYAYSYSFIDGCKSVEGNTRGVCRSATDS